LDYRIPAIAAMTGLPSRMIAQQLLDFRIVNGVVSSGE
jgi:hypothetical protein